MFCGIELELIDSAIDETVRRLLDISQAQAPPVDALHIARCLHAQIAWDDRQAGRARRVRLYEEGAPADENNVIGPVSNPCILIRHDPRPERIQWAVGHELGEELAHQIFHQLNFHPDEDGNGNREQLANRFASRLLLPTDWFRDSVREHGGNLLRLKEQFSTASYELIARRMLDLSAPMIVTIWDQGAITFRRSNLPGRLPPLSPDERYLFKLAEASPFRQQWISDSGHVHGYSIHEPHWKRVIVWSQIPEEFAI